MSLLSCIQYISITQYLAASGGHADIVTILLQNKADTRILTEAGLNGTALHYAAGKGHYEICRYEGKTFMWH